MSTQIPMFGGALPVWADVLIGVLLVISGFLSLTGALGLVRIREFFTRMHPLALASTLAVWCLGAALVLFFSLTYQTFRRRAAGEDGLPPTFAGPAPRLVPAPVVEKEADPAD